MLVLSDPEVEQLLPMTEALIWVREAFAGYTRGEMICPQRLPLPLSPPGAVLLSMPAYDGHRYAGVKLVGVQPENAARHLPTVRASYLLFDGETLELLALMAASRLTAIRTGAAGGLAASLLALPEASTLALIGAGVQAETQLLAALAVRPIQQVWVTSGSPQETAAFIERMRERTTVPMHVASSSAEALAQASLVVTATNSLLPVFEDRALQPGAHVTAIGAFTTAMQEVPDETMARAAVYVDGAEAAWGECGELAGAFARGAIARDHVRGEIGALLEGRIAGREDAGQITVFKSVGLAAQDLACAAAVYRRARESGVGTVVSQ